MKCTLLGVPGVLCLCLAAGSGAAAKTPGPSCSEIPGSAGLLGAGRVLLLGEMHGTRESPAFVGNVACNAVAKQLDLVVGLELASAIQPHLDAYLQSAGTDEDRGALTGHSMWQRGYQDGRNSRAMVRLIDDVRRLAASGRSVKVVAFDASGGRGAQQRERDMAANLLRSIEATPKAMHIVLTGNRHSRVFRGVRGDGDYQPMGHVLTRSLGSERVASLDAGFAAGSAWVCSPDCGIVELNGRRNGRPGSIERDESTRPSGHHGWYFVGSLSASPPANGDYCRNEMDLLLPGLSDGYDAFDQTLGEGWRKLGQLQCQPEAAQLIERYLAEHQELEPYQWRILHFHAGQVLATEGERETAIAHFEHSIDLEEEADAPFRWNAYVRATVAFLQGDRDELKRQREIVAQSLSRAGKVPNLDVVDGLLEHFGQTYRIAYSTRAPATGQAAATGEDKGGAAVGIDASSTPSASPEQWQGDWQAYQYDSPAWKIRFEGRKFYAILGEDDWYHGTIALRPDVTPAEVDFQIEQCRCSYAGQASEAIFEWTDDGIRLATPQPGSRRPSVFNEDSGQVVILKRTKAAAETP